LATAQQNRSRFRTSIIEIAARELIHSHQSGSQMSLARHILHAGYANIVTHIGDRLAATCYETTFWRGGLRTVQRQCGCQELPIAMLFMAHFAVNLNRNQRLTRLSYSYSHSVGAHREFGKDWIPGSSRRMQSLFPDTESSMRFQNSRPLRCDLRLPKDHQEARLRAHQGSRRNHPQDPPSLFTVGSVKPLKGFTGLSSSLAA